MGLIQTERENVNLYDLISDESIFNYYFGAFSFNRCYNSSFRKDNNPSTGFYTNKIGKIIYNDITTGEKLDAIAFVAKKYFLTYSEAIKKIKADLNLIKENPAPPITRKRETKDTKIDIEIGNWDAAHLNYWKDYTITQEELEAEDVYVIDKLKINGKLIPNYRYNLRFGYIINYKGNSYKKIYEPMAPKENKWLSNIPLFLPFGYNKLKYQSDTLIIQKSVKDLILTKRYHTDCISLQNESRAALRENTLDFLKTKYKRIIVVADNDKTGIAACEDYRQRGCEAFHLPEDLYEKGITDCSDLVKTYGIGTLERWLIVNNII